MEYKKEDLIMKNDDNICFGFKNTTDERKRMKNRTKGMTNHIYIVNGTRNGQFFVATCVGYNIDSVVNLFDESEFFIHSIIRGSQTNKEYPCSLRSMTLL